jgi:hypothetical protein
MHTERPVLHGLVVLEELEGPVKRPGWNSCDQHVARRKPIEDSALSHGGTLVSNPPEIVRKSCGKL